MQFWFAFCFGCFNKRQKTADLQILKTNFNMQISGKKIKTRVIKPFELSLV